MCNELFGDLASFSAAGSQLRVHENISRVVSGYLRLLPGAPDALTHQMRNVNRLRGLWLLVRSYSCLQVNCKLSDGGCFVFLILCVPSFDHCSTPSSRCRPVLRSFRSPIWRESQAAVDETLQGTIRSLLRHDSVERPNAACYNGDWIFYSDDTSKD